MDCREFNRRIVEYFTGGLSRQEKEELERHLQVCDKCEKVFLETQQVIEKSRQIEVPSLPPGFWEKNKKAITAPRLTSVHYFWKPLLAGITLSIVVFFGFFLLHKQEFKKNILNPVQQEYASVDLPLPEDDLLEAVDYIKESDARVLLNVVLK